MTNPIQSLAALELAAAAAPIQNALTAIATGDGSVASVTGQGIALEGQIIAMLPTLKKVGINNIAAYLNTKLTDFIAAQTAKAAAATVQGGTAVDNAAANTTPGTGASS